ncbi:MAG: hypothetical protein WA147_16975 [Polaromonas sp.]
MTLMIVSLVHGVGKSECHGPYPEQREGLFAHFCLTRIDENAGKASRKKGMLQKHEN